MSDNKAAAITILGIGAMSTIALPGTEAWAIAVIVGTFTLGTISTMILTKKRGRK